MAYTEERLAEVITTLVAPSKGAKHETVRTLVWSLLTEGLGIPLVEIDQEKREVVGRIDSLLGRTVFEFKSDLMREMGDVERMLPKYLKAREEQTGERYVGIATDGALFIAYEERDGGLTELRRCKPNKEHPREILEWLESVVAVQANIDPEPEVIRLSLGRDSVAYARARRALGAMWAEAGTKPDAVLKRELWATQLAQVYGSSVDSDELFFQHTYLTIVAKTMALAVLDVPIPADGRTLLDGDSLAEAGIHGAVEADFFNWVLEATGGDALVHRIAAYVARFKLRQVKTDVLKVLYESLIDPEQRHDLGEYYTPDWLAEMVCEKAISDPINQRVLDPSCGSGTFLFHAVKLFIKAAGPAGYSHDQTLTECCRHIFGIDIHPVAVIIARVTYLLALGDLLPSRSSRLDVPVYLGDSMQWNTRTLMVSGELLLGPEGGETLHFPSAVATRPQVFDRVVGEMLAQSEGNVPPEGFRAWLERELQLTDVENGVLTSTYRTLKEMYEKGRDHVWGYVARNLSRPVWLSSQTQRAHVVIGNPPWLAYRHMSGTRQGRFKQESQQRGLWAGGKVATHQDLSGYFFARCVELYLQAWGKIAFVMPYAAMNRKQFEGFRTGWWGVNRGKRTVNRRAEVRFNEAWTFDEHVQPLFPVPSCVLFAEHISAGPLPHTVQRVRGVLPRRDASVDEAKKALTWSTESWPPAPLLEGGSSYRERFKNGANIYPRVLFLVEKTKSSGLGENPTEPVVISRRSKLENLPWKGLASLRGPIEANFLRRMYLSDGVAPYRLLDSGLAVIPWAGSRLLDSFEAARDGRPRLAEWLRHAEALWAEHRGNKTPESLLAQIDFQKKLSDQFPVSPLRVIYGASGTQPSVCILEDDQAIVEHGAYWTPAESELEARYLCAVLNSEAARIRVAGMQAKGQWGARHFDKVMFELPIPKFDSNERLHNELADAAVKAEGVAEQVDIDGVGFVAARGRIRKALIEDGIAGHIDSLVDQLLA